MHRMIAGLCLLALPVVGCANLPAVDVCKRAPLRRQIYVTAITAADAYAASGRPVPASVALGREAAATALAVLNVNCPAPD